MAEWLDERALVHVVASIVFVALHVVSGWVMFSVRGSRDRAKITRLLGMSSRSLMPASIALLVAALSGLTMGWIGGYAGTLWWWASVVMLIVVGGAMTPLAGTWMNNVRHAVGLRTQGDKKDAPDPVPATDEALALLLVSRRPELTALVGLGGLAVLVWLMSAKPF